MPSLGEVQLYLTGLLLLVRLDPKGFQYLDISERGATRSFWAMLICAPATFISWLWWRNGYLAAMPGDPKTGMHLFVRLAMIEVANWFVPLVLVGILGLFFGIGRRYLAVVVVANWLSVPFSYAYGFLVGAALLFPGAQSLAAVLWMLLLGGLVFCLVRVLTMIFGREPALITAIVLLLIVPGMFLADMMERFLGLSV